MKRFGFVSAGDGEFYSKRLRQLNVGNEIFVYDMGNGYMGYGVVRAKVVPAAEFITEDGPLFDMPLAAPKMKRLMPRWKKPNMSLVSIFAKLSTQQSRNSSKTCDWIGVSSIGQFVDGLEPVVFASF